METRWPGLTVRKSPTEIFVSIFIYQLDFDPSFVSTVVSNLSPICHQFVSTLSPLCTPRCLKKMLSSTLGDKIGGDNFCNVYDNFPRNQT